MAKTVSTTLMVSTVWALFLFGAARGDEVRHYEKDGVRYRETRSVVRRPVSETVMQPRERTIYQSRVTTEMRETERTYYTPVTEYRWEAEWRGRFNPFIQPYIAHRLVPHTYLQPRIEQVRYPVTHHELIPSSVTEQVPITTRRIVDEEIVRTVRVGGSSGRSASDRYAVARRNTIGGVAKLESDPPRRVDDEGWRSSNIRVVR